MKKRLIFIGLFTAFLLTLEAQDYSFDIQVTGKGKPILLIPGLGCHGAVWDETVKNIQSGYEFHVVTLPGFAGQTAIDTDAYLETVGDELIDYLKARKLKRPVIMGHSLGGFLALYIGSTEPDLASKLVVVDGLPFLGGIQNPAATPESLKDMATMMRKNMETQTIEQYEAMQPMLLKSMMNSDEDIETVMEWGRQSDTKTVAQAMYELYQMDLREDLVRIKAPTLVLGAWIAYKSYGSTRETTMNLYNAQFSKLKGYRLEMTDVGKHFIMLDDPSFFYTQVNQFLDEKS